MVKIKNYPPAFEMIGRKDEGRRVIEEERNNIHNFIVAEMIKEAIIENEEEIWDKENIKKTNKDESN